MYLNSYIWLRYKIILLTDNSVRFQRATRRRQRLVIFPPSSTLMITIRFAVGHGGDAEPDSISANRKSSGRRPSLHGGRWPTTRRSNWSAWPPPSVHRAISIPTGATAGLSTLSRSSISIRPGLANQLNQANPARPLTTGRRRR